MKPLEILALVIIAAGFVMVLAAKVIVKKFDLAKKQTCQYSDEMSEEEMEDYKLNRAMLSVKMMGLAVTVPGIILLILYFNRG